MSRRLWQCSLAVYLAALWLGSFYPFSLVSTGEALSAKIQRIKWIPFLDPRSGGLHSPRDTALNLALYVPFGVLAVLALGGAQDRNRSLAPVVVWGLTLSLLIEALQLFASRRVTNVTDVIANTIGCWLGVLAVGWWQQRRAHPPEP